MYHDVCATFKNVNIFFATEHIITTWNIYTPLGDVIQTDNMADLYGD